VTRLQAGLLRNRGSISDSLLQIVQDGSGGVYPASYSMVSGTLSPEVERPECEGGQSNLMPNVRMIGTINYFLICFHGVSFI
jgi:hypothetical protein